MNPAKPTGARQPENSEVPSAVVAVAVTATPSGSAGPMFAENDRFPVPSVAMSCTDPNHVWPSPNPDASQAVL